MTEDQMQRIVSAADDCVADLERAATYRALGWGEAAENHEAAAALWSECAFRVAQS